MCTKKALFFFPVAAVVSHNPHFDVSLIGTKLMPAHPNEFTFLTFLSPIAPFKSAEIVCILDLEYSQELRE